ncbi:LuxR C-terminal-related transcriptional regulator [Pseudonocardia endophytica]|uniref:DNA-binding NarL/FixJ family response regulator n=1 Tax=Pseudonocardia endophytica TaxID=401976 RepID=A0A4V2PHJ8_PSEEN|nr:response regulator transcription factor [Pseudonocardia endophytica]TCK20966.1 DNA-binding NarL/FixJ family response regulator [Pseudonocardia endophytica]
MARTGGGEAGGGSGDTPILIVDDHELVGSSLAQSLRHEGEDARFQPVRSAAGVLETAGRTERGLIVLDLDLGRDPEGNRIDGVRLVEPLVRAGWRVVVLSGSSDAGRIGSALAAGGFVWVPKNAPFPTLLAAIREARQGRSVMPAGRREELIEMHRRREGERRDLVTKLDKLTQREKEVLALLAAGKRAQAVADHFVVSLATVRTQIRAVLTKLEVGSQLEAVALYRKAHGG